MESNRNNSQGRPLVIGISSRALLDLEAEDTIFKTQGTQAFIDYQREHRNELIPKGVAFPLIKALVDLNKSLTSGTVLVQRKNEGAKDRRSGRFRLTGGDF